jgi:hypothetical protein
MNEKPRCNSRKRAWILKDKAAQPGIRRMKATRQAASTESNKAARSLDRDAARAKLQAAGLLATELGIPDNLEPVPDDELEHLGQMKPDARPSEQLVDEDRVTY